MRPGTGLGTTETTEMTEMTERTGTGTEIGPAVRFAILLTASLAILLTASFAILIDRIVPRSLHLNL